VSGIELVMCDGSLQRFDRHSPNFEGMVVGLGAFGVLTSVTLDLVPAYRVRQDAFVNLPWDALISNFDEISMAAYSMSVLTKCSGDTADRIWMKSRVDHEHAPDFARLGLVPGAPFTEGPDGNSSSAINPFGVAGSWLERLTHSPYDVEPSPRKQIQSEYLIAREQFPEAMALLRRRASEIDAVLHAMEIRTIAADQLWLSPAYQRNSIGLHFTWRHQPAAVNALTRDLESRLTALGARPHWAKILHADARTLARLYPRMDDFRLCVRRLDPEKKFSNDFLEKHVFSEAG
jgi:alditol oxidase